MTHVNVLVFGISFEAMVERSQKGQVFLRKVRCLSLSELKKAGLDVVAAKRMHLMIDPRRHTMYHFNVDRLSKLAIENRAILKKPVATEKAGPVDEEAERAEAVDPAESPPSC